MRYQVIAVALGLALSGCSQGVALAPSEATGSVVPAPQAQPQVVGSRPEPTREMAQPESSVLQATLVTSHAWTRDVGAEITLELENLSDSPVSYTAASGMLADFWLESLGRVVWRYSNDMAFTQALAPFEMAANGQRSMTVRVSARTLSDLEPGVYQLNAALNLHPRSDAPQVRPISVILK
ncbi:BsuPI-related putative proteinase inhibitor [Ferrimonas gelatinilytica]|uniref:Intracellular proteinase inhibitor BsuPI domain-containing protein n=1 Tax=Ferrimonas gelatinilytica TaxID=1255257 RepID=A0ABP9RZ97_9GAMM